MEGPTITPGITINVLCYYSLDFTSTLLYDNDVLKAHKHAKEFNGKSMLKFFDPTEIVKMLPHLNNQINNQVLDDKNSDYDHNYENCILCCTCKKKIDSNVYIPGIICVGLCYIKSLIIPSGLQASNSTANVFNSRKKAYQDGKDFHWKCDFKSLQLIYEHQQQEYLKLINALEQTSMQFHKLLFHKWIANNTPVNALTDQPHEMIWHQCLVHLSPATIQNTYKYL